MHPINGFNAFEQIEKFLNKEENICEQKHKPKNRK